MPWSICPVYPFWTRVTFNWNHIHNIAYDDVKKIEFFYREQTPLVIRGKVKSVTDVANDNHQILLATESYNENSRAGNPSVDPSISVSDEGKFIGSILNVEGRGYEVLDITQDSPGPIFKLQLVAELNANIDENKSNSYKPILDWVKPKAGEYFMLTENLSNPSNWTQLNKSIDLVSFSSRTEIETDPDGNQVTLNIGGIEGDAIVIDDPGSNPIEGLYKVTFDSTVLSDHPDQTSDHIYWENGIARLETIGGAMKAVQVVKIEASNPITLWVYDGDYVDGSNNTDIKTHASNSIEVNFHPGYKVYLEPEPSNNLDKGTIIPSNGDSKKDVYLALRAVDDSPSPTRYSELCSPVTFFGLYTKTPVKPNTPGGPAFSTRPDTFGKCTYTFNIEIGQTPPFSIAVYRSFDTALLNAIYAPETVEQILDDLDSLNPNTGTINRFNDLANVVLSTWPGWEGAWKKYDGYRFPEADLDGLLTGSETIPEKEAKLKAAIQKAFIPILEQPMIYDFMEIGTNTSSKAPKIRDRNGQLLNQGDPEFDPFPMVRKYTSPVNGKDYLRFTDYQLEGASQNLYFYYAVEVTRELRMSEPSGVLGPVRIINAFPAESPYIGKVETVLANQVLETSAGVRFKVNPYLPDENVKALRIYRTTDENLATSVRLMDEAGTITIENDILDDFSELSYPPFNQDIFYRVVALREILNERDELEYIPSKPSDVIKARVVDNINPEPPEINANIGSTSSSPDKLLNIDLSWSETCYQGKYYLYKMTDAGQWQLVDSFNYNDPLNYNYTELLKEDSNGDTIYHRFKVDVENTGGLLNLENDILTL
ncbi:hypothetical protein GYB22_09430 [bacterium]|nr:hypothetical protein [bacterium]